MENIPINTSERIDYLVEDRLKIIQSKEVFSFSMDAVLLAKFASIPLQKGRIVDLCTGNGVIPLLFSLQSKAHITGVELQEKVFSMAQRSVTLNRLHDQISILHMNLKEAPKKLGYHLFDAVSCNPPYMPVSTGKPHHNEHFAIARHEIMCTLEDVVKASAQLLKPGGKASFVHRPARMMDLLTLMRAHRLEPKRIQFVHPKAQREANMLLIEGIKDAQPDLRLLPPLIVYRENNTYTDELMSIYFNHSNKDHG